MISYSAAQSDSVLKNGEPYQFYGILGDGYLQQRVLTMLQESLLSADEREFNQDVLDGETATINELLSKAGQLPFIASHRVIVVRNMDKMEGVARASAGNGKSKSSKAASPSQILSKGLKELPATTVLIALRSPETPEGRSKGTPRCLNAKLDKILESNGIIIDCLITERDQATVMQILRGEAKQMGVQFEQGAAVHLMTRVGHDIGLLLTELEKCALRVGQQGIITKTVIDEMTRRKPSDTVFDLLEAIGNRQPAQAIGMLRELLSGGEVPERFLALLVNHLRMLWQVRALRDQKVPPNAASVDKMPEKLKAQFPADGIAHQFSRHAWRVRKMQAQASRFSQTQIQQALEYTFETDLALKGIENDGGSRELLLERLIMRLGE